MEKMVSPFKESAYGNPRAAVINAYVADQTPIAAGEVAAVSSPTNVTSLMDALRAAVEPEKPKRVRKAAAKKITTAEKPARRLRSA